MSLVLKSAAILFAAAATAAPTAPPPNYNAQSIIQPERDPLSEAKAPKEDRDVVDIVQAINSYVNKTIDGEGDLEHYGIDDLWVQYPPDAKGDCEDYALTKLGMLGQLGVPIVNNTKLVSVVVHLKNGDMDGHEILAIRMPKGTVLYLDNMNDELMTRAELVLQGYQFFDWKA